MVVSQQKIAKSVTLPLLACLLSTVHPGAMCSSAGHLCAIKEHQTRSPFPSLHDPVLMLTVCALAVDRGPHVHLDWSVSQGSTLQQNAVNCVFYQNQHNPLQQCDHSSSSVGSEHKS